MNKKNHLQKIPRQIFLLIFLFFLCVGHAVAEEKSKSIDTTVDSILGALADMTVDEAKKILNLQFTRDIREKVCGFHTYTANRVEQKDDENKNQVYKLFPETCDFVSEKIERNIFSEQLIEAFKKDMVLNGVLLARGKRDYQDLLLHRVLWDVYRKLDETENIAGLSSDQLKAKLTELIKTRVHTEIQPKLEELLNNGEYKKLHKEILVSGFIYLLWKKVSIKEAIQQALSESGKFRDYEPQLDKVMEVATHIKSQQTVIKDSLKVSVDDKQKVFLKYQTLALGSDVLKPPVSVEVGTLPEGMEGEVISLLFKVLGSDEEEMQKRYIRELLDHLLYGGACKSRCIKSINQLIQEKPRDIFDVLASLIDVKSENSFDDDIDRRNLGNFKALGTLNSLSDLSNVQDKESARAILDKYLADENTRTARYWEPTWTLGTLIGVGAGKAFCSDCQDEERSLATNLFMPFGLFFTNGRLGAQFHIVDLGQYAMKNDKDNDDDSNNYRDAIAPGLAMFARFRRYPISIGVDYTYKSSGNGVNFSEDQYRLFVAMDILLFNLN